MVNAIHSFDHRREGLVVLTLASANLGTGAGELVDGKVKTELAADPLTVG